MYIRRCYKLRIYPIVHMLLCWGTVCQKQKHLAVVFNPECPERVATLSIHIMYTYVPIVMCSFNVISVVFFTVQRFTKYARDWALEHSLVASTSVTMCAL